MADAKPDPAPPFDVSRFRAAPLDGRAHRATFESFAKTVEPADSIADLLASLPDFLGASALRDLSAVIAHAGASGHRVLWGLGGHVIKVGLAPLLVDLSERGFAHGFVLNGAAAIHDAEIALGGSTSEDVGAGLFDGTYGSSDETGRLFADAAARSREENIGFGTAIARTLSERDPSHAARSLLCHAARNDVPVTVHVAVGTDTVHMHPACDGGDIGAATHRDFLRLVTLVERLDQGVYLNVGSAVVLPEVFMKAVAMVHNARAAASDELPARLRITTANLDMLRHYRTRVNVVQRPSVRGMEITGHHEIMVPLLRAAILSAAEASD